MHQDTNFIVQLKNILISFANIRTDDIFEAVRSLRWGVGRGVCSTYCKDKVVLFRFSAISYYITKATVRDKGMRM